MSNEASIWVLWTRKYVWNKLWWIWAWWKYCQLSTVVASAPNKGSKNWYEYDRAKERDRRARVRGRERMVVEYMCLSSKQIRISQYWQWYWLILHNSIHLVEPRKYTHTQRLMANMREHHQARIHRNIDYYFRQWKWASRNEYSRHLFVRLSPSTEQEEL